MKKIDYPALITETVDELRSRERTSKDGRVRLRAQLLRLLKNQETISLKAACQICGITPKHGYALWKKYREKGFAEYLRLDWKPRRAKLDFDQQAKLLARARQENGFASQAEAISYLQNEFGAVYTQSGVCLLFQRLKIKAKEPRPRNTRAVAEEQIEYKKTLQGER